MPVTLEKQVELTVDELVSAITQLSADERSEFELRLQEMQVGRSRFSDAEIAHLADDYRLPADQRERLRELLARNREGALDAPEEAELEGYMAEMDRRLQAVADDIQALAERRRQDGGHAGSE